MELSEIVTRLDDRLRTEDYADVDASANGLQVGPPEATVDRAAFAVDAAVATAEAAADADADLLVTHHGVSWGGIDRVTGRAYRRIAPLVENDLALYVSHLPLDGHRKLGNAAGVADLLDLEDRVPFGSIGGEHIGQQGRIPGELPASELRDRLSDLDTGGQGVQVLDFGPDRVEDVAVVTGSGTDWLDEAVEAGADALVTGEGKQQVYHRAREAGLTVVLAGHYATETFGVRRLMDLIDEWGVETTWIDHPTGL
ncbi:Nif3-like dinuclear metal center hexameric protein [Halobacteriales archaeon QS_8_69_26]|nr:MAG: Nif3-like dinuclear metal center hexameric protein [Halobacteriales archaeon QS_8_69_26]